MSFLYDESMTFIFISIQTVGVSECMISDDI